MKELYNIQRVISEQFEIDHYYSRLLFKHITLDNAINGLVGSRGVGKTTYLLHLTTTANRSQAQSALYVSADNPFFLQHSLIEVADYLYKETDTRLLCIDEIHKYPNWQQELKNIADIYKRIKVVVTGSSMIDVIHGKFDLSRRVTLHRITGLSFREYLEFYLGAQLPSLTLKQLLTQHQVICADLPIKQILKHFRNYLEQGYYLFCKTLSLQYDKFQAVENIAQKTIYEDIATLHTLKTPSLQRIEQTYKFILNTPPSDLNPNKLAKLIGKSYDQVNEYLTWLTQAGLINSLYAAKSGKAFIRTPKKLLPENASLMYANYLPQSHDSMIGKVRETFFVNQLHNARYKIFHSHKGDFCVDDIHFEIGGRNKSDWQLKGVEQGFIVADDILIGDKRTVPLYLFGFLY